MNMLSLPVEYQDSDDDIVSVDSMDESDMYHPSPPKPLPMTTLDTFSAASSASSAAVSSSTKATKARTTTTTTTNTVAAKSNRKKKYNTSRKTYAAATTAAFSSSITAAKKATTTTTTTSSTTNVTDNGLHTTRSSGKKIDPRFITEEESIIARNNDIRENRVLRNQFYSYKGLAVYREPTKGAFDFGDRDFYVFANPNVISVNKQKWYTKDCIRGIDYTVDTAQAIVWYEEYLLAQQENSTQQKSKRKKISGANSEYAPTGVDDIDATGGGGRGKGKVVSGGGAIQERDIHILLSPMAGAVISPSSHSNGSRKGSSNSNRSSSNSSSGHELTTTTSKNKRTAAVHNVTTANRDEDAVPHITTITTPGTKREFLLTLPDTTSITAPCDISPAELQMFIQLVKAVRQH